MLILASVWQLVAFALYGGGIFVDVFEWLGIPWNTIGIRAFIGKTVGWLLLELPMIIALAYILWRQRRST